MVSSAADCNGGAHIYTWVQQSMKVPSHLGWSLNGKASPGFQDDVVSIDVNAYVYQGLVAYPCSELSVVGIMEREGEVYENLTGFWIEEDDVYRMVEFPVDDLVAVRVFVEGKELTRVDYTAVEFDQYEKVLLSLLGLFLIFVAWSLGYLLLDQYRRKRKRQALKKRQTAGKDGSRKHSSASDATKRSSCESVATAKDFEPPQQGGASQVSMEYVNKLRQRKNRHLRTKKNQRKAIEEIKQAALVKFKAFLPEDAMAVAVWLETTVCHLEDFEDCYGITLFEIAILVHRYLLKNLRPQGGKAMKWDQPEWSKYNLVRDGYFFVIVVMAELLLEGFAGSGVFTSKQMDESYKTLSTLSLGLGLTFVLPFMMSMSRNASPYLYNMIISALPSVLCRDLTGGIVSLFIPTIIMAIIAGLSTESVQAGFAFAFNCFSFGMFMLLATMLYLFRVPDPNIMLPNGRQPHYLLIVVLALMIPFVVNATVEIENDDFWVAIHSASLAMADFLMAARIKWISETWHCWLSRGLALSKKMKCKGAEFDQKLATLSREQREEALWLVNHRLPDKATWKQYPETSTTGFWEYFYMAMIDMKSRNIGTPEKRSAELFDTNINEIIHGVMYFFILGFSALPMFVSRGTGDIVSRGVLYAMMAFLLAAGTIELFVSEISDVKQKEIHELLLPASKRVVKQTEAKIHKARLKSYGKVIASFQMTTLRYFLLSTIAAFLLEPAALFVSLPFSAGYQLVLYAMISRMFLSGYADRAHIAVVVAISIGLVVFGIFAIVSTFTKNIAAIIVLTCFTIRGLRFMALAYATWDSTTPVFLTNLVMEFSKTTIIHVTLTAGLSLVFFWFGQLSIFLINDTFFTGVGRTSTTQSASLAVFFCAILTTIAINLVVFGFMPLAYLCLGRNYVEWEQFVEYRVMCFLAFIGGFVIIYLPPLSLGCLLGFITSTVIYAHTMRHLVLQPRNTWHNTIDPNDIPMTSGKRILDGGGLTAVKPEIREQQVAEKLRKGLINAVPLMFDNKGLGDQVLEYLERKHLNFNKSALKTIIPMEKAGGKASKPKRKCGADEVCDTEENEDPYESELSESSSSEESSSDEDDDVEKGDKRSNKRATKKKDKMNNTFLQSIIYNLVESLVSDCKAGNVFVYLCDGNVMYKEGFIAMGIRRKEMNRKMGLAGPNGDNGEQGATWRASPLWREQATNRLNVYIGCDSKLLMNRDKRLPDHDEAAELILGQLAEALIHEYVEDATRSHALAVVAELAMLDARKDGYLPRSLRVQLDRMSKTNPTRIQHLFDQTEDEITKRNANAKRVPVGWRYDPTAWVEVCNIEKEIALEIGDYCETLIRKNTDWKTLFRSAFHGRIGFFYRTVYGLTKSSFRIWYCALRADMELHREVCAYLKHLDIAPGFFGSFGLALGTLRYVSRPIYEALIFQFAWKCSPLYFQMFSKKKCKKYDLDKPVASLGLNNDIVKAFKKLNSNEARSILYHVHEMNDEGQTLIPGILAQVMDEIIIMRMPELKPYWVERRKMCVGKQQFLKFSRDTERIVEQAMMPPNDWMHKSKICHAAEDLLILGYAGSSHKTIYKPKPDHINVVVDGSATIFYVSGGVTTCLMQLINHEGVLKKFNLHVLAEVASVSTPRIACPTTCVNSIHPIPLHDITSSPESSIHSDKPYFEVALRKERTTPWVLRARFHPLLRELIRGCCELQGVDDRSSKVNEYFSEVIVALYEYFEHYDWNTSWSDGLTWLVWVQSWIQLLSEKPMSVQRLWAPTLPGLQEALVFFSQALRSFICDLPPADLYHSSHHGIGALKGIVHKQRYKSRLVVWDHGILLRERLDQLCATDQLLHPFTRNAIIGLTRLTARLVYNSADVISPCTSVEMYRKWICLIAGRPYNNDAFIRRIQPISNGTQPIYDQLQYKKIANYYEDDSLNVDDKVVEDPDNVHVVMLSHVLPIKDVENAIKAAYQIAVVRKMTCYRLHIFGGLDKDPKYVGACKKLITDLGIDKYVKLMGLGSKFSVFPKADLFLNSSFSEGLPMAILEAAMAKVAVVCTDVGGSREVVPDDRCRAPPRDDVSLGDAQILTLCGFIEAKQGQDLNDLVLSSQARKLRKEQGEKQYQLAMNGYTEEGTYDRHFELMERYATSLVDPNGGGFNPPPFSVKVGQPINVSVQAAKTEKKEKKREKTKRDVQASRNSASNRGLYSNRTMEKAGGSKSVKLRAPPFAGEAPRHDYSMDDYGEEDEIVSESGAAPRLTARSNMDIDMEYIRNIRTGSHHPDAETDIEDDDDESWFEDVKKKRSSFRRFSKRRMNRGTGSSKKLPSTVHDSDADVEDDDDDEGRGSIYSKKHGSKRSSFKRISFQRQTSLQRNHGSGASANGPAPTSRPISLHLLNLLGFGGGGAAATSVDNSADLESGQIRPANMSKHPLDDEDDEGDDYAGKY